MNISASELQHLKERGFVRRSDVYRYLETNYRRLIQLKVGTNDGASWDETAAVMSQRGYLNARGLALNGNAVRRVFRRVEKNILRRETEATRETGKPLRSPRSSERKRDSRPSGSQPALAAEPVRQRERSRDPPPQPQQTASPPSVPGSPEKSHLDNISPEVKAKLDRIRQDFAETDRKRFGRF